ncbi:hypothetical protein [Melittangium boletus]|uniref:hypothetical protein n=1 Tax=Melittangium boletus TaxID=83453 RepID=UPI003DA64F60
MSGQEGGPRPGRMRIERRFLPTPQPPRALCWSGEAPVDPLARHAGPYDAAVMSPDGRHVVLYERLGTRGLLLREGAPVRELHRDDYCAHVYEYPVALASLPDGRTLLAHCPEEYCRLELEDVATGERLTRRDGASTDVFHSRLQFSPGGRFLLSAGWVWHPVDTAQVFDVARALEQPTLLDGPMSLFSDEGFEEIHAATHGTGDTLLLEREGWDEERNASRNQLVVYSASERRELSRALLDAPLGTCMPVGAHHVLSLFEHPRLIELATGHVVERWPDLDTGGQHSSIVHHIPPPPPLALDALGGRLAVGTPRGIEILRFGPE